MKENLKKRFENKVFRLALAGFAYQVLVRYGLAPDLGMFQNGVDLLSYALIGAGIYKSFGDGDGAA